MEGLLKFDRNLIKFWETKMIESFLKPSLFMRTSEEICKEYYALSNRYWLRKRQLKDELFVSVFGKYVYNLKPLKADKQQNPK